MISKKTLHMDAKTTLVGEQQCQCHKHKSAGGAVHSHGLDFFMFTILQIRTQGERALHLNSKHAEQGSVGLDVFSACEARLHDVNQVFAVVLQQQQQLQCMFQREQHE